MTTPRKALFRAGDVGIPGVEVQAHTERLAITPQVLLADISEFQPQVTDSVYLQWSKAIVIRALYGADHDDSSWYSGWRRRLLHQGGARFLGIYQYLVADQAPVDQVTAFKRLVGDIQPGEVFIPDVEEGDHTLLTGWYNEMLNQYGPGIQRYLWTYTGEAFGAANGLLPVEWIAAYRPSEPSEPHKLWQFTDSYDVPGVGTTDCSLFHGTIDELAALAYPVPAPVFPSVFGPPRNLTVRAGDTSVMVERCDPPASVPGPIDHYMVGVYVGSYPSPETLVPSYPRYMKSAPMQFGNLHVAAGTHMTCRAVAVTVDGHNSDYVDTHFQMG